MSEGKHVKKGGKRRLIYILIPCAAVLIVLGAALLLFGGGDAADTPQETPELPETPVTDEGEKPEVVPGKPEKKPAAEKDPDPEPEPEPQPGVFTLSFAGDCTLGTEYATYGSNGSFVATVGDDYAYPFRYASEYFLKDDFTFVNLESALTNYNEPAEKTYRFRGPPEYVNILTAGGVELVNVANNHTYDYGQTGYNDTKAALEGAGVSYCADRETMVYTMDCGIKLGFYAVNFPYSLKIQEPIQELKDAGADIIICSFHWGIEGVYCPNDFQKNLAHAAIDAGADIVVGTHPHVLQPVEEYNGGVIFYSLGNFSFGGNRNPVDKDSVIMQQTIVREPDGAVRLGETTPVPFRLSGTTSRNDYCPVPLEEGSAEHERALSKLNGTFTGPDLVSKEEETDEGETPETEVPIPEEPPIEAPPAEEVPAEPTEPGGETPPEETAPPAEIPETPPEEVVAE